MSSNEISWWEGATSRVLGSVSWGKMKELGDIQLSKPWADDADRMWRVAITAKLSDEMVRFWGKKMCGDYPMELYIFGRNEDGLPSGVWILQKMSQVQVPLYDISEAVKSTMAWTIEFVQDERWLSMPIRRGE